MARKVKRTPVYVVTTWSQPNGYPIYTEHKFANREQARKFIRKHGGRASIEYPKGTTQLHVIL
jgi:hypothetical protein